MMSTPDGLYNKFHVERTDRSSEPGGKHHGCKYFVLDLTHDLAAKPALATYAAYTQKARLAHDLREWLREVGWPIKEAFAPDEVDALKLDLANARAEATDLRAGLAQAQVDVERARQESAEAQRLEREARVLWDRLSTERAEAVKALGLNAVDPGHLATAVRNRLGECPTEGEINALQASRDEARAAEAHWKARADERAAETLAREQDVRRERERAETAEAACRRLDTQNKAEIATAEAMRERAEKAEATEKATADVARRKCAELRQRAETAEAKLATAEQERVLSEDRRRQCAELRTSQEMHLKEAGEAVALLKEQVKMAGEQREAARRDLGTVERERDAWARKAGEAEALAAERVERIRKLEDLLRKDPDEALRLLEASRRDAASLREELATVNARVELKAGVDESHVQRYENARREMETVRLRAEKAESALAMAKAVAGRLEAQADSLGTRARVAEVELASANAQLEVALIERDRALAVNDELRQQLADLQADRQLHKAETLSIYWLREWGRATDEIKRLREELAQRPLNPIDLDAIRKISDPGKPHVCDVWKPAADSGTEAPWVCETCDKPFKSWVEPARNCAGSGAPPGPLDGRGRYRCPECYFSLSITPKALEALPEHPPVHACEDVP